MEIQHIVDLETLNEKVGGKQNLYQILSSDYYLPKFDSHACTVNYLTKYTQNPIPIYVCELEGTKIFQRRWKHNNAEELLDKLEQLLRQKGKKPTGMDRLTLPNLDWLCTVLHKEDPEDTLGLFKRQNMGFSLNRDVNEK